MSCNARPLPFWGLMQSQHRQPRLQCKRTSPGMLGGPRPRACGRRLRAFWRGASARRCARRSAQRRAALPAPTARPACPSSSRGPPTPAAPRPLLGTCMQFILTMNNRERQLSSLSQDLPVRKGSITNCLSCAIVASSKSMIGWHCGR